MKQPKIVPPPQAPAQPADRQFSIGDAQTIEQILAKTTVQGLEGAAELAALIRRFRNFVSAAIAAGQKKGRRK